jgi:hypothetical protein
VVGGGGTEPTSACRSARCACQRAEEQQLLEERAEELCGRIKQQFASYGGPGHRGGDAVGPGVARGELRSGPGHSRAVVQALGGRGLGEDRAHRTVHRLQTTYYVLGLLGVLLEALWGCR